MSFFKYLMLAFEILFQISCSNIKKNDLDIENIEIDLYALTSFFEEYITIPEEYYQFYQIDNESKCEKISGSVIINEFGTIYPYNETRYYYEDGTNTTEFIPDLEIIKKEVVLFYPGRSKVKCKKHEKEYNITLSVIDYSRIYAEKELEAYVEANITKETDQYKQYEMMTKYASNFKYNSLYQSHIYLVIVGEGDSWATSYSIKCMAEYAKIKGHLRFSKNDPNSQGDVNFIAFINNKYYISNILFNQESGKNKYSIEESYLGYSYIQPKKDVKEIIIYQYDGYDENIIIPDKIDGKEVVGLDKGCFENGVKYSGTEIKSIKIPTTITIIGDDVFSGLNDLEKIEIPKTVKTIGKNFVENKSLKEIIVDKDNSNYNSEDGVLFDKKKEILMTYPCNKEGIEYQVKEKVTNISEYSFYKNLNLLKITIPKSIKYIGEAAFGESNLKEITFKGDPPFFGIDAFLDLELKLKYPKGNKKWESIKDREEELGFWDIELEEIPDEDEGNDNPEEIPDEDEDNDNTLAYVLISAGIIIIICAIVFIFLIRRRKKTSVSIDTIGGEGLINDRNEIAL